MLYSSESVEKVFLACVAVQILFVECDDYEGKHFLLSALTRVRISWFVVLSFIRVWSRCDPRASQY